MYTNWRPADWKQYVNKFFQAEVLVCTLCVLTYCRQSVFVVYNFEYNIYCVS